MKILILIAGLFFVYQSAFGYTPPIGIPDPGMWGSIHPIDTPVPDTATKCSNWPTAASTGCYYIDNSAESATDSGNTYGYPNHPRLTIPTTYAAGTYVELHGGPYTVRRTFTINGTVDNLVWIVGKNAPSIQATWIPQGSYFIIDGMNFNTKPSNFIHLSLDHHVCIRNNEIHDVYNGNHNSMIDLSPNTGTVIHDVIIYNNHFHDIGDYDGTAGGDQDLHGIKPSIAGRVIPSEIRDLWVLNNTFYHVSGNGMQIGDQSTATDINYIHYIYAGFNVGHHNRQALLGSKRASDVIFSQNTCYDQLSVVGSDGGCFGYQYGPDWVWIIFNNISDTVYGIRMSGDSLVSSTHRYAIGNVITNIKVPAGVNPENVQRPGYGIASMNSGKTDNAVNNTFYNIEGGIEDAQLSNMTSYGNILSGLNSLYKNGHYYTTNGLSKFVMDYDVISANTTLKVVSGLHNPLSVIQSTYSKCLTCTEADPLFVSAASHNFHLQEGSPAIHSVPRADAYQIFYDRYGISIDYDFDGNPRPSNGKYSAGAFEYNSTVQNIALPKRTKVDNQH